jgi:hypothetical protein
MRNLEDIRNAMLEEETLTTAQTCNIKGGKINDDKRRPRPGAGVATHCPSR